MARLLRIIFIRSSRRISRGREGGGWPLAGAGKAKGAEGMAEGGLRHDYAKAILNRARTREVGHIKIMNPLARNG